MSSDPLPAVTTCHIHRPSGVGAFQFVVLATLRAAQLMRGCRPRVDGVHKPTITAQLEVSEGKVTQIALSDSLRESPAISGATVEQAEPVGVS
jgi:DNA-directed RNA polymerase subunit K/omega